MRKFQPLCLTQFLMITVMMNMNKKAKASISILRDKSRTIKPKLIKRKVKFKMIQTLKLKDKYTWEIYSQCPNNKGLLLKLL